MLLLLTMMMVICRDDDDDDVVADGRDDGGKCQTLELQNRFGINNATPALHLFSSSTSL